MITQTTVCLKKQNAICSIIQSEQDIALAVNVIINIDIICMHSMLNIV